MNEYIESIFSDIMEMRGQNVKVFYKRNKN